MQGVRLYRLGNIDVDTSRFSLTRDGEERHLRQQAFQVLIYLLEQRERLVTKNELIDHVWRDTAVTDNALEQCLAEIRKVLGDDSRTPRFIKTVPRAGYRFIGEVEEIRAGESALKPQISDVSNQVVGEALQPSARIGKRGVLVSLAIVLIVASFATIFLIQRRRYQRPLTDVTLPQTAGKRSVAVMFFDNQSGSADFDWLREGLADMLITDLSRSKNLTILSRQQLRTLLDRSGRPPSERVRLEEALDVAQKSKAAIVIMGSFSRLGEQIRIDAQLHDARDGQLLAAERLVVDQPAQILTQVDLLAIKLASHLGEAESNGSGLTSVMTNDLAAYRYYSLAVEKIQELQNPEAIALLEKAIAIDPDFAMAYARIGYTYAIGWGRPEEAKPFLEKAFKLTQRLTEKDKLSITAWYAVANQDFPSAIRSFQELVSRYPLEVENYQRLGRLLRGEERLNEAIEILKQGLVIDSESKDLYNGLGGAFSDLGRHDEAIAMFQRYVALAPNEANAHDSLGMGYEWAGSYDEAILEYERALDLKPDFYISVIHLGNTRYQQGRHNEALKQFERFIEITKHVPEHTRGYTSVAALQRARARLDLAEAAARRATSVSGGRPQWEMFAVALARGDLSTAERLKQALEKLAITDRGARGNLREQPYFLGLFALKSGRADEAVQEFKEVLSHRPPTWLIDSYEDCLANAYLEIGRLDEAIAEYERILKLNPNYPLVHYHLAQAHERKGQQDQARAEYQRFLQVWQNADADIPEVIAARKARSRLL